MRSVDYKLIKEIREVIVGPPDYSVLVIEYWDLRFICDLVLGIWDYLNSCFTFDYFYSPMCN